MKEGENSVSGGEGLDVGGGDEREGTAKGRGFVQERRKVTKEGEKLKILYITGGTKW